ncbi:hypothetical protein P167DRAFT_577166 [Morchella conica CCBAS932]|uniref:Uncharacterized protein n=1 Tax=Morchella conica CCBAS932 TaxID=1392247 RepID=A0A3N4KGD2_9PEZI|nr:hypothetical protein P167DRAFT_577166 [Morchella conica CCBAS932]
MASNYGFYESRGEYGRDNHIHRYGNPGNPPDDQERNRNGGHPYSGPPPVNSSSDNYPFFLAGDGIAREVIQTDIPRYLGNNAVCKPGNRQGQSGFLYKGYRPLTDAQIQSLKEDSVKYTKEKQQHSLRYGRDGPDYLDSLTFNHSHQNNPDGYNPLGTTSLRPAEGYVHPISIPASLQALEPHRDPRYRYLADGRPWYDNLERKYVKPFRDPGTISPEPIPPVHIPPMVPPPTAQSNYGNPNHAEAGNILPSENSGRPPTPRDSSGAPLPGRFVRQNDGRWYYEFHQDIPRTPHR